MLTNLSLLNQDCKTNSNKFEIKFVKPGCKKNLPSVDLSQLSKVPNNFYVLEEFTFKTLKFWQQWAFIVEVFANKIINLYFSIPVHRF